MDEKYTLVGVDGNAYSIMGYTSECMRSEGFSKEDRDTMLKDATSGDYNHLLCVCVGWVKKCNERAKEVEV